ncbi:MAG: glycosyl transferase [Methylotenera sp.]|nr:glycosyl transferase [Methylotenera sp.]MSP98920.1 glycosyl transferase [Methylotenera sp.]
MRFQLDHDWQGNMSTPRARVGESVKIRLMLVLCFIWVVFGLTGHAPWKPFEPASISIVKSILDGGSLIAPLASGAKSLETPPLYYLSAAASAKLLSPLVSIHDGARLINTFWLSIILLMVGMTGRELWSRGVDRHATFIMIGTIGLVISAHSLTAEVANLASTATGFYALALAKRRPWRASGLFGTALGVGFLCYGTLPILTLMSTALMLPLFFKPWRTQSFARFLGTAILIASPLIIAWLGLLQYYNPRLYAHWWQTNWYGFHQTNHLYFSRILIWYAWPALPLALLGLWRYRQQLLTKPKFQLMLVFFSCSLFFLGSCAAAKNINALPLLLPLVALAAGSVEHLKRGMAAALNWFGVLLFGLIGGLIWLGWIAMMTGHPTKLKERVVFLSGLNQLNFNWLIFVIALIVSIIWIFVCLSAKQTNKSTVSNWAVGMTFTWGLLMTLWLPLIDSAKSYQPIFASLNSALPKHYTCINSLHVEQQQRLLLNYYTDIKLQPLKSNQPLNCNLYLLQDTKGLGKIQPDHEWKNIWSGKRATERKESFRLFQRSN